jgi:hypothetical protein
VRGFASIVCLVLVACTPAPSEHLILDQFFAASRVRDRTALQKFATVLLEPLDQGIVTDFKVIHVTPERGETVDGMAALSKEVTIDALVRLAGGRTAQKVFVITMRRPPAGSREPVGRWMITGIRERSRPKG